MSYLEEINVRCRRCYGSGKEPDWETGGDSNLVCIDCKGVGCKVTELGIELIDFLKNYYGLEVKK